MGIGCKTKVLGKVEIPSGMGGVNGVVRYTVVDSLGVPRLTPVSLLKQVRAVIDLNSDTMELTRIETTTSLRVLPSGHVAHKLTASGGWRAPTFEQTKLFQARSGDFIPMILPVELRPRRQRQSADLSSGFAHMVSIRPHPFSCHRDCNHDWWYDTVDTDFASGDVSAQEPSMFDAGSRRQHARPSTVRPYTSSTNAVAKAHPAVPCPRHPGHLASRTGLEATRLISDRTNGVHALTGT